MLDLIHRLRERGLGVVVISHNLADVFEVADRIVVLRLGREAGDFDAQRPTRGADRRRDHRRRVSATTTGEIEEAAVRRRAIADDAAPGDAPAERTVADGPGPARSCRATSPLPA